MKNRKGRLNIGSEPPLTIPQVDFILEELALSDHPLTIQKPRSSRKNGDLQTKINLASGQIRKISEDIRKDRSIPLETMDTIKADIVPVIQKAARNPDIYYLFEEMQSKDEYTYKHNIGVGIIATYLGEKLGLGKESLSELTLAATLHDIGKTRIPKEIVEKPGKLTESEYLEMKRHTIYGYELLKNIPGIPQSIPLAALQHHEREDGQGYPLGLKGKRISYLSKIVAIADVFHAMSSERAYHQAMPFYLVIEQMNSDVFGKFHPGILLVFINQLMATLVGKEVLLTNHQMGTVLMIHPYDPLKALLKTETGIVDLREEKGLKIQRVISG